MKNGKIKTKTTKKDLLQVRTPGGSGILVGKQVVNWDLKALVDEGMQTPDGLPVVTAYEIGQIRVIGQT